MRRHPFAIATALLCAVLVCACYESPDVKVYEPGVYKGEKDPLLEKQRSAEHQEALRQRFNLVQSDR